MKKIPLPTTQQELWSDLEMGVIIHHCMETYHPEIPFEKAITSIEGMPAESFAPTDENTDQWIEAAVSMGAKYAVLVANHCSGFSLWPTSVNDYSMARSPYNNGQTDVVRDFIQSCRKYGVKPGLYYSTGRNSYYGVTDDNEKNFQSEKYRRYVDAVNRQLEELWRDYGELFEIWFDGGVVPRDQGGPRVLELLEKYQPNAVCFQGPSGHAHNLRWVGNENGLAPMDCWSIVRTDSTGFDNSDVNGVGIGTPDGDHWIPAETDMPNRKHSGMGGGWFWAANEDHLVYTAEELMEAYLTSVGRNTNLLMGMCIDQEGHFPAEDTRQFARFGQMVREAYAHPVGCCRGLGMEHEVRLDAGQPIHWLVASEDIHYGQRVRSFHVDVETDAGWERLFDARSIGHKRIIPVDCQIRAARLIIDEAVDTPIIRDMTLYR